MSPEPDSNGPAPDASAGRRAAPLLAVLGAFAVSRIVFHALGVRFDAEPLTHFWQYLDVESLRTDLWSSVYHLHAQPPLFNLFLGGVLKVAGPFAHAVFSGIFLAIGLALHVSLYLLMRGIGVRAWLSAGVVAVFAFSPASIVFENHLFYPYPMALVLTGAALAFYRLAARRGAWDAFWFCLLCAAAVLTRSVFHLFWFALCAGAGIAVARGNWRRAALATLAPALLVVGVYAKNWAVFGSPATSSWLGMSVARRTLERVPLSERRDWVHQGRLSPLALIDPFSNLDAYPAELQSTGRSDARVLSQRKRSTGANNFNHAAYVEISRRYLLDARVLLRERPGLYVASLPNAWLRFFAPPTHYRFVSENLRPIRALDRVYSAVIYGVPDAWAPTGAPADWRAHGEQRHRAGYLFMAATLAAVALAVRAGLRDLPTPGPTSARGALLLFIAANSIYVALVVNFLELGENNRFRFMIEPLLTAQIALAVEISARRIGRRADP